MSAALPCHWQPHLSERRLLQPQLVYSADYAADVVGEHLAQCFVHLARVALGEHRVTELGFDPGSSLRWPQAEA